jgi:hypothetical protein
MVMFAPLASVDFVAHNHRYKARNGPNDAIPIAPKRCFFIESYRNQNGDGPLCRFSCGSKFGKFATRMPVTAITWAP